MLKTIGTAALLLSLSGAAFAGSEVCKPVTVFGITLWKVCEPVIQHLPRTAVAPEFGAAGAIGAVTLLAGGLAIFLGRRRRKFSA
jgi:LPXTG-motif cell wall-anchored protein